jgi:hypothetical protein
MVVLTELEAELVPHLVTPLELEAGRADHERRSSAVTENQLLENEAGLDRLAEADIVSDEQADARHVDRPRNGIELVVLDGDAGAERGVHGPNVRGGDGAPAHGIQKRIESRGLVEAAGRVGEVRALEELRAGLELPDDGKLLAETVVDGLKIEQMLGGARRRRSEQLERRECARFDLSDDVASLAHADELPRLGDRLARNRSNPLHAPLSSEDRESSGIA